MSAMVEKGFCFALSLELIDCRNDVRLRAFRALDDKWVDRWEDELVCVPREEIGNNWRVRVRGSFPIALALKSRFLDAGDPEQPAGAVPDDRVDVIRYWHGEFWLPVKFDPLWDIPVAPKAG